MIKKRKHNTGKEKQPPRLKKERKSERSHVSDTSHGGHARAAVPYAKTVTRASLRRSTADEFVLIVFLSRREGVNKAQIKKRKEAAGQLLPRRRVHYLVCALCVCLKAYGRVYTTSYTAGVVTVGERRRGKSTSQEKFIMKTRTNKKIIMKGGGKRRESDDEGSRVNHVSVTPALSANAERA